MASQWYARTPIPQKFIILLRPAFKFWIPRSTGFWLCLSGSDSFSGINNLPRKCFHFFPAPNTPSLSVMILLGITWSEMNWLRASSVEAAVGPWTQVYNKIEDHISLHKKPRPKVFYQHGYPPTYQRESFLITTNAAQRIRKAGKYFHGRLLRHNLLFVSYTRIVLGRVCISFLHEVSCSSPIWDNLSSGHQRYPLKGLNLGYMYWGQKHSSE